MLLDRLRAAAGADLDLAVASDARDGVGERRGHRAVMTAIKSAIVLTLGQDPPEMSGQVSGAVARWLTRLEELQGPDGLFSSSGNLASPPDSAFSLGDAAMVVALIRGDGRGGGLAAIEQRLTAILRRAMPALIAGGVHTPNHRWELAAVLATAGRLLGVPEARARAQEWLAEGVDAEPSGLYSERSPNYASRVTNPSLLALARAFDRPDLRALVHANLHTTLDLTSPRGMTETVQSRRQDQARDFPLGPFLAQFAAFGECERCAAATAWASTLGEVDATDTLAAALQDPVVAAGLRRADRVLGGGDGGVATALGSGVRLLREPRLWRAWEGADWTLAYAGSDVPEVGRVASGLACNPTFLRLGRAGVEVASVRLSREFFSMGPFRPTEIEVHDGAITLRERVSASYYQPMPAHQRRAGGDYPLEHEGRFAAAMAFSTRAKDEVTLVTTVRCAVVPDGVDLEIETEGPACEHALEVAIGPGSNPEAVGIEAAPASDESVSLRYQPGEAYRFLGGSDAAAGERRYVTWRSPGRQRVSIRARQTG